FVISKIRAALVIPIAGTTINRPIDLPDEIESPRSEARLLHKVAGETDKLRLKSIDGLHRFRRKISVAFEMQITEVKDAKARVWIQIKAGNPEPIRLRKPCIQSRGYRNCAEADS